MKLNTLDLKECAGTNILLNIINEFQFIHLSPNCHGIFLETLNKLLGLHQCINHDLIANLV